MTLPNLLRRTLFATFCFCTFLQFAPAIAQTKQSDLESISRQMFREGNERFILVEALKDKFIAEGQKYELKYADDVVKINGKTLKEPFQKHYNSLLKKFSVIQSSRLGTDYKITSLKGEGVKLRDVLNPASDFRTPPASAKRD